MPIASEADQSIREAVAVGSGVDLDANVLLGQIDNPSPDELYAVVPPGFQTRQGWPDQRYRENFNEHGDSQDTVTAMTVTSYHSEYALEWLGFGAMDRAQRFGDWIAGWMGGEFLRARDIALIYAGDPAPTNAVLGEKWEERAAMDLTVSYWSVHEYSEFPDGGTIGFFTGVPIAFGGENLHLASDANAEPNIRTVEVSGS